MLTLPRNVIVSAKDVARPSPVRSGSVAGQLVIQVLIADDHDAMRRGIRQLLEREPSLLVVGEAANYRQLLEMVRDLKPDTVVMDVHMRDEREFDLAFIRSHLAGSVVIATSIWADAETQAFATSCGAVTLVDKVSLGARLVPAIVQHSNNKTKKADD